MKYQKFQLAVAAILSFTAANTQAALTSYNANGVDLVYSSISNITWTKDANLLGTLESSLGFNTVVNAIIAVSPVINDTPNVYDVPANTGHHSVTESDFGANGLVSWFGGQAFASYLNSISYAGSNQWTLPSAGAFPRADYYINSGQFGQLFYSELGGSARNEMPIGSVFINAQNYVYFYKNELAQDPKNSWLFSTGNGNQNNSDKSFPRYAWAVVPEQVAAVPVPTAVWLFCSGLLGLLSLKRRNATN